jgi:hypothetical protein
LAHTTWPRALFGGREPDRTGGVEAHHRARPRAADRKEPVMNSIIYLVGLVVVVLAVLSLLGLA